MGTSKYSGLYPQTVGVRAALGTDETSGDVAQAIHLTNTFRHGPAYEPISGYTYARDNNPNVCALEEGLAALEGNGDPETRAIAFASGVAAGAALVQTLAHGDRVLFHTDTYLDFKNMIAAYFPRWGLEAVFVDMTDLSAVEQCLSRSQDKPFALVWFETPSNPQLDIIDISRVVEMAHQFGAKILVDSTFATPALQQPLCLGVDVVLQATTKYIGGHSDTMGGALIVKDSNLEIELRKMRKLTGGVMAPFSAWLAARGLQTLFCRVERQSETALQIAHYLQTHPAVEKVHYPGLETASGHQIAKKQMRLFGALVSFQVKGGAQAAIHTAGHVKLFTTATSVGGVESLIEHRPSVEGTSTTTPEGLLRASIGLEHPEDLINDLAQALNRLS